MRASIVSVCISTATLTWIPIVFFFLLILFFRLYFYIHTYLCFVYYMRMYFYVQCIRISNTLICILYITHKIMCMSECIETHTITKRNILYLISFVCIRRIFLSIFPYILVHLLAYINVTTYILLN